MEGGASRRRRSRLYRTLIAIATAISVTWPSGIPAGADASGFGYTDGESVTAGAESTANRPTSRKRTSTTRPSCSWDRLSQDDAIVADRLAEASWSEPTSPGDGTWYHKLCQRSGDMTAGVIWVPQRTRANPSVLAERALDEAPIPLPAPQMNPPADEGAVVNVELWLWIDPEQWQPVSASAGAGGVQVTTVAAPERVEWSMGNGDTVTCVGPGTPYDSDRPPDEQETDCTYTYREGSARAPEGRFTITATVTWTVRWSVSGAVGGGELAPATRTSEVDIAVAEIQTLNR